MINFVAAYITVLGYSGYTNNYWPIAIVIGGLTAILLGLSVMDMLDGWEK